jgi:methionyl-tRNA formyltransferase
MRIVFIGTVEFSLISLKKIIDVGGEIVGVCTKKESSFNADFIDLTPFCEEKNIPTHYVKDINNTDSIEWIKSLSPDIIFCFGWSSLIGNELLCVSKMGIVGFHPAYLPQNRGRHPIIWALALGLEKTASTFFFMDKGADSGDILSQKEVNIDYTDDARTLYNKIVGTASNQIAEFVPNLISGEYKRVIQNHEKANLWRKRGKKDGLIDFRMSSKSIYNLVRALTKPYVGAHLEYHNSDIIIWKVEEVFCDLNNIEPGKVLEVNDNKILIKVNNGAIRILEHEFEVLPKVGEYL